MAAKPTALQKHTRTAPSFRRVWVTLVVLLLVLGIPGPGGMGVQPARASDGAGARTDSKVDPQLQARLAVQPAEALQAVIVTLNAPLTAQQAGNAGQGATRQERVIRGLQAQAETAQRDLKSFLQDGRFRGKISQVKSFWIVNAISLQATAEVIQALAARPEVEHILVDEVFSAPVTQAGSGAAWDNLGKIGAPQMWAAGFRGQGVVVANMDTGVDGTHPDLAAGWRGGSNSWYDPADVDAAHPNGIHATPVDLPSACSTQSAGHGTATMSVMAGKTVGVAPDAQWIAVKIFSDASCSASVSVITSGFQWLLDPDGNPATLDAPQVVSNSWGKTVPSCGFDATQIFVLQPQLQALRAAGILPIVAAGNSGPGQSTGTYPATDPDAFAVGATDTLDGIAIFSSRGPNSCDPPGVVYPALTAPGVDIKLAAPGGGYRTDNGTSFAAPHAAGALALLLSAKPGLSAAQQESLLRASAVDLGAPGADNNFGAGRLDVWRAYTQDTTAQIGFDPTALTVSASDGQVSITVSRGGALANPVSVDYTVTGGTARAGSDYQLDAGTLTFAAEQTQAAIPLTLIDDHASGPVKTLVLSLGNPQGGQLIEAQKQFTLTILDPNQWQYTLLFIGKKALWSGDLLP